MPISARSIVSALLPRAAREWLGSKQRQITAHPPAGSVSFGDLRRVHPIARSFGIDRGRPIDRHYIESFLESHRADIRGAVLEIADDRYTKRFGSGVTSSDVLHAVAGNERATIVADLTNAASIESERFDAIILTQTLQFIPDVDAAIRELHRILKPAGVVLATVPCISQISRYDADRWGDYWRFTSAGLQRVFSRVFGAQRTEVRAYGNFLTSVALLAGLACEDVLAEELEAVDADYEVIVGVRAVK